jgi:hypothetical protein
VRLFFVHHVQVGYYAGLSLVRPSAPHSGGEKERDQLPGWLAGWLARWLHLCSSTRDAKLFSFAGFCPSVLLVSLSLGGDVLLSAGDGHLFSFRDELPKASK